MPINFFTQGVISNPTTNQLLAQADDVESAGSQPYQLTASSSGVMVAKLQHRNAADDATISEFLVICPAERTSQFVFWITFENVGEFVRVISEGNYTTNSQFLLNKQ